MYVTIRGLPGGDAAEQGGRVPRRRVPAAVLAFGVVSMLTDISSESVTAVLPLYITAVLGLGPLAYGFVDGLYQGASAAVRILGGWWADARRRPKWVAFVGYAASAVSRIVLIVATGFAAITAVIAVDRLGKGLRTGPRDALIASASEPTDLGRNFGVHRSMDTLGALIGPLVAFGVLAAVPSVTGGFRSVFVFSAAFAILGLVVLAVAVPDLRRPLPAAPAAGAASASRPRLGLRWADLVRPGLRRVLVASALLGLVTVGDGFLYLALADRAALAATYFPLLIVGTNVAYMALAIPIGKLADRIGGGLVFLLGHTVLLGAYAIAAGALGGTAGMLLVLLLLGTFYAATDGVLAALATRMVPEESRASGIAAAQTVVALARFGSSVGFGLMWQVLGRGTALWVMAAGLVVALAGAAVALRPLLRTAKAAA